MRRSGFRAASPASAPLDRRGAPLPGEHGFRFFPRFYTHIVDTMSRIPYRDRTVAQNLVDTTQLHIARFGNPPLLLPPRFPRDVGDIQTALFAAIAILSGQIRGPPRRGRLLRAEDVAVRRPPARSDVASSTNASTGGISSRQTRAATATRSTSAAASHAPSWRRRRGARAPRRLATSSSRSCSTFSVRESAPTGFSTAPPTTCGSIPGWRISGGGRPLSPRRRSSRDPLRAGGRARRDGRARQPFSEGGGGLLHRRAPGRANGRTALAGARAR